MPSKANKTKSAGTPQIIFSAKSPSNGNAGTLTLFYASVDASADNAQYAVNYSAATGVYTVPAAGHKNMIIRASTVLSDATGYLSILVDGVTREVVYANGSKLVKAELQLKSASAGQTIKVVASNTSATSTGGAADRFEIFATE